MSKGPSKFCSISNYLKKHNDNLHELIDDLCLGRMLAPKKGAEGVTFLMPDKKLFDKLKKMSESEPEQAVKIFQSMVITDYLPEYPDFKSGDVPNYLGNKIKVKSYSSKGVELEGGGMLELDKKFVPRDDRKNLVVYHLSGEFPLVDNNVKVSPNNRKSVKGGAQFASDKQKFFLQVLAAYCNNVTGRDPALEALVSLLMWSEGKEIHPTLLSLLSVDTLATLAVILQPYKTQENTTYLTELDYNEWAKKYSDDCELFSYIVNPVEKYNDYMIKAKEMFSSVISSVEKLRENLINAAAKPTLYNNIQEFYSGVNKLQLPEKRVKSIENNQSYAEGELRLMCVIMNDNQEMNLKSLTELFSKFNLNKPYLCEGQKDVSDSDTASFYSSVYLLSRSNALFYLPGLSGNNVSAFTNGNEKIDLEHGRTLKGDDKYYSSKSEQLKGIMEAIGKK